MHIRRNGGHITLRDRAAPFWVLGLVLLASGVVGVAMPLGLATNAGDLEPWERVAIGGVGLGVIAGAVWWLARSPATRVHLDLARRRVRLVRLGIRGRHVRQLSFEELESVEIELGTDSDGGTVWRPVISLRTGGLVLLSELWSHDLRSVQESVAVLAAACQLPQPAHRGTTVPGPA